MVPNLDIEARFARCSKYRDFWFRSAGERAPEFGVENIEIGVGERGPNLALKISRLVSLSEKEHPNLALKISRLVPECLRISARI